MNKRILLLIAFMLAFLSVVISQKEFYKHMEGKLGDNISIVLDLVVTQEKLNGYYYYFFDDWSGDSLWTHYGKSMPVIGKIHLDNTLEFSEFDPEVKGAIFEGKLNDGMISGTWTNANGKQQLPFEVTESYPPGTMAFKVIHYKDRSPLFARSASPAASLEMSLLLPVDYPLQAVADSVSACIYRNFFNNATPGEDPSDLLVAVRDLYVQNYVNSNEGIYQEGAASFNWNKVKEIRILHNEHDILSIENYDYGYTGGAHGLSVSKFRVIDLKDGHRISLDEIFRDGYRNDLRDIINAEARKKFNLDRNQSLRDAGFYDEFIDPVANFYLTRDGIGFYYNQYEVAPFAMGPVNVFISYNNLLRILRQGSPVYRLITSK